MADTCPITNLDTILLAADGSEFSEGAVREAISLAEKCSSKLIAMTVIEANPEYSAVASGVVEKEELRAKELMDSIVARAGEAGVNTATAVHEGEDAWHFIADEAAQQKAEIVVMGRRGRTGLARVAMGSVTARVIGHAPCDVMVVPREARVTCSNILLATDGSTYSDAAAREAIAMAKKCGGTLSIVSVASSEAEQPAAAEHVKIAAERAGAEDVTATTSTAVGKAYIEIIEAAKKQGSDLIVVGCHGRTGLAKLFMGSVAERVVGHSPVAVLVACA